MLLSSQVSVVLKELMKISVRLVLGYVLVLLKVKVVLMVTLASTASGEVP